MYKFLIAFVLLSPLSGILQVEHGAYAVSVGIDGYPNGASIAYTCYASIVALVAFAVRGKYNTNIFAPVSKERIDSKLRVFGLNLVLLSGVFLLVLLFGFGSIRVVMGEVHKGEFRVSLGPLGFIAVMMSKCVLPALLAYAAALYQKSSKSYSLRLIMAGCFFLIFITGASWGFKNTAISMLMPALLIIYWRISFTSLIKITSLFSTAIVGFYYFFDASVETYSEIDEFLWNRFTVIQGDVSWYVWDLYISNEIFPSYWPTLLAVFGDKILTFFGLSESNYGEWVRFHYDLLITNIAGVELSQIEGGHTITATPFTEGLVSGGVFGIVLFAVLGGMLVGKMHALIQYSLIRGADQFSAIAATYFYTYVFWWLNGGAVVQLFHVSTVFSMLLTYVAMQVMTPFDNKVLRYSLSKS